MGIPNMLFVSEQTQQGKRQMDLYFRPRDKRITFLKCESMINMGKYYRPTSLFRIKGIRKHIQTILNEEIYGK